ncbi:hypothetical protein BDV93DRAFT_513347 [Ceratobasidium sp. AG-I]|nr:hypothetical protein BDV93DRAFT_513347 [Ceratobasidium sp. AG-I]
MRNGPEHELQLGMLHAILAGEADFRSQEHIRLATPPAKVNFQAQDSANHYRGKKSRFGFIQNRVPVIVHGIFKTMLEVNGEEHEFVAAMVQQFVAPERQPVFPWDRWAEFLGINAWAFEQLHPIEAAPLNVFYRCLCSFRRWENLWSLLANI